MIRIAVMGRSVTMGTGVADEEVYTARLQSLLDKSARGRYEVLNFAVGGYELPQITTVFDRFLTELEPDLVLVPMTTGMFLRRLRRQPQPWPRREWANMRVYLSHFFVVSALQKFAADSTQSRLSPDWEIRAARASSAESAHVPTQIFLQKFIQKRNRENVPVVVVFLKTYWDVSDDNQAKVVRQTRQWVNDYPNAAVIDTTAPLRKRVGSADYIYYGDRHPNAKVHDLYARIIHASLPPLVRKFHLD